MDSEAFLKLVADGDGAAVADALATDPSLADARSSTGASALQWSVYHREPWMVETLAAAGAKFDLASACATGRIDFVAKDGNVDALSADGFRPVALAVAFGHNDIVRKLLDLGADPNLPSPALANVPPLQSAVFGRNLEGLKLLIEAGAEVNARQGGGFTALMGAAQNGDDSMVAYLLECGADPAAQSDEGKTALDLAGTEDVRGLLAAHLK